MNDKRPRLLDLFCGGGGAAMGYYYAGFQPYGIDNQPQPHYPFPFLCMDALEAIDRLLRGEGLTFSNGETLYLVDFAAIHASPPCQYYSRLRHLPWLKDKKYWRSIPPTRNALLKTGLPFIIENVEDALIDMPDSIILCGRMFDLPIYRHRRFEAYPFLLLQPPHQKHTGVIAAGRASIARRYSQNTSSSVGCIREISRNTIAGHIGGVERARQAMQIDWMNQKEISQAVAPALTKFCGIYLLEVAMKDTQKPFTEAEFESLVDKASQPLEPERKPDAKKAETSESPTSGDCSGRNTHSDTSGDI